jgi:MoaA/NifB/PqqE/SkfB family radical SAM enzyme
MCDIWKRDSSGELPLGLLERNRDALRELKVQWVVLSGGEPLMHSQFVALCRFLRQEGIRITLLTAGVSLAKRARDVAYNVDDVIVSLDGPRAVHDSIRGVRSAYDLLAAGIVNLLSLRPELKITARTTVQKLNHNVLCDTVDAALELDLSGISFLAADVSSSAFNREQAWPVERIEGVGLSKSDVRALEAEIEAVIDRFAREIQSGYIAESAMKLRRIAAHFRAQIGEEQPVAPLCNAPWVSAVLSHDGSVRPCFFHSPIGNIHQESLERVVNGQDALAFRAALNVADNETCRRCVCSLRYGK